MPRVPISSKIQADVLVQSKRRCALCFALNDDKTEKNGQIAHINKNSSDASFNNLVWLCLQHHDKYDSTTSQTKNYTEIEIKNYRDAVYKHYKNSQFNEQEIKIVQNFLTKYSDIFNYIFSEYDEMAYAIDHRILDKLSIFSQTWLGSSDRSFNSEIRELQDKVLFFINNLIGLYDLDMYDLNGSWIKFNNIKYSRDIYYEKKLNFRNLIDELSFTFQKLDAIATN